MAPLLPLATKLSYGVWSGGTVGLREIGVYWYLFSNHCSRRCIYETVIKKEKAQLLLGVLELYDSSLLLAFSCFAR